MATRKGLCSNFGGCSLADRRQAVVIGFAGPLTCPDCGRPLGPMVSSDTRGRQTFTAVAVLAIVVSLGSGGWLLWRSDRPSSAEVTVESGRESETKVMESDGMESTRNELIPNLEEEMLSEKLEPARRTSEKVQSEVMQIPRNQSAVQRQQARDQVAEGRRQAARGQSVAARESFAHAVELDPQNAFAWANLGAAEMLLGNAESARLAYQRALDVDGDNWLAHYNLGVYFVRTKSTAEALDHLERSVSLLRRNKAKSELATVIEDLETNKIFLRLRHDPRFRSLLSNR